MEKDNILESKFHELVSSSVSYILSSLLINSRTDIEREVVQKWVAHRMFELDLRNKTTDAIKGILNEYQEELHLVSVGKKAGRYLSERIILGFKKDQNG